MTKPLPLPVQAKLIGNVVIFQACWLACVLGGNMAALVSLPVLLVWHRYLLQPSELPLLAGVSIVGIAADSLLFAIGWIHFPNHHGWIIPPWLMVLWFAFATTLRHSLAWLMQRPLWAAVLGAVAAPWSYYAGMKLEVVIIPWSGFIAIAVIWALLLGTVSWLEVRRCNLSS